MSPPSAAQRNASHTVHRCQTLTNAARPVFRISLRFGPATSVASVAVNPTLGYGLRMPGSATQPSCLPLPLPSSASVKSGARGGSGSIPSHSAVTVIVVTWNGHERLAALLPTLRAQRHVPERILVVDNGAAPPVSESLADRFPEVEWIRSDTNLGFAAGNNLGLARVTTPFVALINDDARAEPGWLQHMLEVMTAHPDTGAVAPLILDGHTPDRIDSLGVGIARDGMARQRHRGEQAGHNRESDEVIAFSGCACLLRSQALDQTGGFDEAFFAYCEDTDLSLRLQWMGWTVRTCPRAVVRHDYSQTGGAFSAQKVYWVERNHFWVAMKNFPATQLWGLPLVTLWRFGLQALLVLRRQGDLHQFVPRERRGTVVRALCQAHLHAWRGLPGMLRQRRSMQATRKVAPRAMRARLVKHRLTLREILAGPAPPGTDEGRPS